jgi:hypothetical protein
MPVAEEVGDGGRIDVFSEATEVFLDGPRSGCYVPRRTSLSHRLEQLQQPAHAGRDRGLERFAVLERVAHDAMGMGLNRIAESVAMYNVVRTDAWAPAMWRGPGCWPLWSGNGVRPVGAAIF